jgi:hypothetical protein
MRCLWQNWFQPEYKERRAKCKVPDGLAFKTKLQIALELTHSAYSDGWCPKYIGFDSFFGNCQSFLDSLPHGMVYFADVHKDRLAKDKCLKVVERIGGLPGKDYARQLEDGALKYALCNEAMDATPNDIRKLALKR